MAMAVREAQAPSRRAAPMRTRTHGGSATRALAAQTAAAATSESGATQRTAQPARLRTASARFVSSTRVRLSAGGGPAQVLRTGNRPMVKATAGVHVPAVAPVLAIVPRRRRTARLVAVGFAMVFSLMFAAAAFQTQLAQRELQLDKTDRAIRLANEEYSRLRRERAELRSPGRLVAEATALGMSPALDTTFMAMSPDVIATIQQSTGGVFDAPRSVASILDSFMAVKSVAAGNAP